MASGTKERQILNSFSCYLEGKLVGKTENAYFNSKLSCGGKVGSGWPKTQVRRCINEVTVYGRGLINSSRDSLTFILGVIWRGRLMRRLAAKECTDRPLLELNMCRERNNVCQ